MAKFYRLFSILLGIMFAVQTASAADTLDDEGYPIMYVRGTSTDGWSALDSYKFTRSGNIYSIHLDALNGNFKISGDTWEYNFGGTTSGINISSSTAVTGTQDGSNFNAVNLSDVDISFTITPDTWTLTDTEIQIIVAGEPIPEDGGSGEEETPVITYGTSGTLPVLHINVYQYDSATESYILDSNGNKIYDNEVIDKDLAHKEYFQGEYWLDMNDCQWLIDLGGENVGSADEPLPLEIKARGNYTRTAFAKKPFKLKLGKKQNLLNMNINGEKSKHWAILAHADDSKGYLRNFTGFALAERIGLPWTPRQQPVEVIINGDYRGLYFLTESIRAAEGRVPIEELDDLEEDRTLISGGYIVELDNYDEDESAQIQMEEKGQSNQYKDVLRITFDTPEEYSDLQRRFVNDQFTAMNDLIGENSDEMWSYLDIDDLARYYIVVEIISHVESFHGSTYLFRDRGEGQKWHFSPLWDCGNGFNGSTSAFLYDCDPYGNTWIPSLRLNDTFNAKVKETWQWFMGKNGGYNGLTDDIKTYCAHIADAAIADAARWNGAETPSGGQSVCDNSDMASRQETVLKHLSAKINWLAQQSDFGVIDGDYAEPARDTTPAAPLPSYAREPNPDEVITVYFIDDDTNPWETAYAYIWGPSEDGIENNEALGSWPGTQMEATTINGEAGYVLSFEPTHKPAADAKIIFNCGSSDSQTESLTLVNGNIYYRSGKVTGADLIIDDANDANTEYFDILGRRIASPTKGLYIERNGTTITKRVVK